MTTKNRLLCSAAVMLALSLGAAEAQTRSQNDEITKAPASAPIDKQKAASDSSKDVQKNAEPAMPDTTKSKSMSGADQHVQDSSKSSADKSATDENKPTGTNSPSKAAERKPEDIKPSDSKSGTAAKDTTAQDSKRNADSKTSDKPVNRDSARAPEKGTGSKAEPNAAKSASDVKPDAAKSAQSGVDNGSAAAAPAVSKEQETKISAAISATKIEPVTKVDFSVSIGAAVPSHVRLHPLPATIVSIVPEYRGYEFFVVREEIVIVEPRTKKIVKVIERSGPSHASTTSTRSEKFKLSDRDRATLRKSARSAPHATTGSSETKTTVTIGERLPASVEITEFPDEVYREVPAVRSYRYYSSDRGLYLVDPSDRTVIEEID